MKKISAPSAIRLMQLASCGAIIGLYAVKGFGYTFGFDFPLRVETAGAGLGAGTIFVLKVLHVL